MKEQLDHIVAYCHKYIELAHNTGSAEKLAQLQDSISNMLNVSHNSYKDFTTATMLMTLSLSGVLVGCIVLMTAIKMISNQIGVQKITSKLETLKKTNPDVYNAMGKAGHTISLDKLNNFPHSPDNCVGLVPSPTLVVTQVDHHVHCKSRESFVI